MSHHVFVDESKQRDYLLVASVHTSGDLGELRKIMNRLTMPGQRRIHMKKESDSRRRQITDAIVAAEVNATVYNAGRHHHSELDARAACLRRLIEDNAVLRDPMIVLEQDDSLLDWDRRQLFALVRSTGHPQMRYQHQRAGAEPLLGLPDAIAWCWAKGGDWRRRIQPAVNHVRDV